MSLIKECDEGSQKIGVNDVLTRELFDSTSTSSSNGSTTTSSTGGSSACSSSSLQECYSNCTALSPLAALPYVADSCKLSPLSKLIPSTNSKPSSSPASAIRYPRKLEHDHNGAVKRSMGLMKLRRQGSHPPATPNRSSNCNTCNGTFNQAAAARELMASLERLSMKEKTMGPNEEREKEAQRALLRSGSEESINASRRNGIKAELPFTAKIAAAMDAEGLIGVQEEISVQYSKYKSRVLHSVSPPSSFKSTCKSRKQLKRPAAAGYISGDHEMRPRKMQSTLSRRRSRWIILRRLRSSRALLGKIWRKFKRVFSSSSRKHLQIKELLKVNTFKD